MKRKTVEQGRELPDQLLALAGGVGGVSRTEAAKACGVAGITAYNALTKLQDKGQIVTVDTEIGIRYCLPGEQDATVRAISNGDHEEPEKQNQRIIAAKPGQYVKMPGHVRSVFELGA